MGVCERCAPTCTRVTHVLMLGWPLLLSPWILMFSVKLISLNNVVFVLDNCIYAHMIHYCIQTYSTKYIYLMHTNLFLAELKEMSSNYMFVAILSGNVVEELIQTLAGETKSSFDNPQCGIRVLCNVLNNAKCVLS